ncbi:MAG: hypothetical protein AAF349_26425 [Cyanobacteria bacterium P01_A01_bin.68]
MILLSLVIGLILGYFLSGKKGSLINIRFYININFSDNLNGNGNNNGNNNGNDNLTNIENNGNGNEAKSGELEVES